MARWADSNIPGLEPHVHAMTPKQAALIAIFSGVHDIEPDGDDFDIRMIMWADYVRHRVDMAQLGIVRARGVVRLIAQTA